MAGAARRLVLVRHAQAEPAQAGQEDADRPLARGGRSDAEAAGAWLAARGVRPDLVLCSTAVRTRQTWAVLAQRLSGVDVRFEEELYRASAPVLVHRLAELEDGVAAALVVGHEPVVSRTAVALAGEDGADGAALARLRAGVPTSGVVVLGVPLPWTDLAGGTCTLEALHLPER